MAIDLNALEAELRLYVRDISLHGLFKDWLNEAQEEIALDFDLPALKLLTPALLTVNASNWLYDAPSTLGGISTIAITAGGTGYTENDVLYVTETGAQGGRVIVTEVAAGVVTNVKLVDAGTGYSVAAGKATTGGTGTGCTISVTALLSNQVTFHKNLFQAQDSSYNFLKIPTPQNSFRFETLDGLDPNHDDTGTNVTHVAFSEDGTKVGIYPMAAETIRLWFYEKPTAMTSGSSEPSCIPEAYRKRVLIPKVIIKNWRILNDLMANAPHQSLQWWQAELMNGLYGHGGDLGLLHYLAKSRIPKRRGGRDPIGWRWN